MLRAGDCHNGTAAGVAVKAAEDARAMPPEHGGQVLEVEIKKKSALANVLQACFSVRVSPSPGRAARDPVDPERSQGDGTAAAPITAQPTEVYNPVYKHGYISYSSQTP